MLYVEFWFRLVLEISNYERANVVMYQEKIGGVIVLRGYQNTVVKWVQTLSLYILTVRIQKLSNVLTK